MNMLSTIRSSSGLLPPPKVYLVDRDYAVGDALCRFSRRSGVEVAVSHTSAEFVRVYAPERPSCLLIGIEAPGDSELALLHSIRERYEPIGIVALGAQTGVPLVVRVLRAGALNFIEKPLTDRDLLDGVSGALEQARRTFAIGRRQSEFEGRLAELTKRQHEILQHVVLGKANKVIARDLGISERTVEVHRHQVLRKMRVGSAVELARLTGEFRATRPAAPCGWGDIALRYRNLPRRAFEPRHALAG